MLTRVESLRSGGLIFPKSQEYQKQYNKNHVAVSNALQTNGYALNEEWCQFLKENHFLVGLSLDGTEEIHNAPPA